MAQPPRPGTPKPAAPATFQPYVPASQSLPEFTTKAILLGAVFGLIFGASTVYLGLRAGLTVSASIPIAVLAISVLKRLGGSTILENNIVQTIGSAGESVAAGVVFTVPALIAGGSLAGILYAILFGRGIVPEADGGDALALLGADLHDGTGGLIAGGLLFAALGFVLARAAQKKLE